MIRFLKILALALPLLTSCSTSENFKNKKELLRAKGGSVLKISFYTENGRLLNSGAGFFISRNGHFLMSRHVFEAYLRAPDITKVKVENRDGQNYKNLSLVKCGEKNITDLCLLKIDNIRVPNYFRPGKLPLYTVHKESVSRDLMVEGIGHCKKDFSYYKSRAKFFRNSPYLEDITRILNKKDRGTIESKDLLILLHPHCKGDSGGPLFTDDGKYVGIFQEYISKRNMSYYYIALPVTEIEKFINLKAKKIRINPKQIL